MDLIYSETLCKIMPCIALSVSMNYRAIILERPLQISFTTDGDRSYHAWSVVHLHEKAVWSQSMM